MMKRQTVKDLSIVGGGVVLGLLAIKTSPVIAAGYVLYPATTIAVGALAGMKAGEIAADVAFTATDFAKEAVSSFQNQWDARKSVRETKKAVKEAETEGVQPFATYSPA